MRQKNEMRPYQDRIATHLYEHDAAMAVLRPGGGKTVTALTAIEELISDKVIRHALVIAPKRVARVVWPDEIELWKHTTRLRYKVLDGSPISRMMELQDANVRHRDITIVGLDVAQWLMDGMVDLPDDSPLFDLLVIDEISRLRNPKSKRAAALAKEASRFKMIWGLTGTLRPNSAQDLFMPARVVTRNKLWGRSFYKWQKTHFYPTDFQQYNWAPLPGHEDQLNAEIAPYIATVADNELIQPEPTIVFDKVDLPREARARYDEMEKKLVSGDVIAASAGVATGKLAQMANGFVYGSEFKNAQPLHDEKRDWLLDIVENSTEPTLLVYEFLEDLYMMQQMIPGLNYLGAGASDAASKAAIELWNKGELPFMALHPASGGHGLNLQHGGADMCWLSPTWSPEYWEQTIARINRSGQKKQVMVRVCVATNTVDELKLSRVYNKMTAQEAFEAYLRRRQTRNKAA
jgi:SNF2 family DNA or RNA helicase